MIQKKLDQIKLVTNGSNRLKVDVRDELERAMADNEVHKKVELIVFSHQEKLIPRDIKVNKNA